MSNLIFFPYKDSFINKKIIKLIVMISKPMIYTVHMYKCDSKTISFRIIHYPDLLKQFSAWRLSNTIRFEAKHVEVKHLHQRYTSLSNLFIYCLMQIFILEKGIKCSNVLFSNYSFPDKILSQMYKKLHQLNFNCQ